MGGGSFGGLSASAKIGIGVVIPLIAIALLGIALYFWLAQRRKRKPSHHDEGQNERDIAVPEAMSKEVVNIGKPAGVHEMPVTIGPISGLLLHPKAVSPPTPNEPGDTPLAEMDTTTAAPPHHALTPEPPADNPKPIHPTPGPYPPTFSITTATSQVPRKPLTNSAASVPLQDQQSGLQVVAEATQSGSSNYEQQVKELQEREQAIARRLAQMAEMQRLEDEREGIRRRLADLGRGDGAGGRN